MGPPPTAATATATAEYESGEEAYEYGSEEEEGEEENDDAIEIENAFYEGDGQSARACRRPPPADRLVAPLCHCHCHLPPRAMPPSISVDHRRRSRAPPLTHSLHRLVHPLAASVEQIAA